MSGRLPQGDQRERISNFPAEKLLEKKKTLIDFDPNVNRDGMKEGKVAKTASCSHQILAQIRKTIADIFLFVDFHLYCTKPESPSWGLFEGGWGGVGRLIESSLYYVLQALLPTVNLPIAFNYLVYSRQSCCSEQLRMV